MRLLIFLFTFIYFSNFVSAKNDTIPNLQTDIDFKQACIENTLEISYIEQRLQSYRQVHTSGVIVLISGIAISALGSFNPNSNLYNLSITGITLSAIGCFLLLGAPRSLKNRKTKF
jgi:hypothetical protein